MSNTTGIDYAYVSANVPTKADALGLIVKAAAGRPLSYYQRGQPLPPTTHLAGALVEWWWTDNGHWTARVLVDDWREVLRVEVAP